MGAAQTTVTMREKFEGMIADRFNSLLTEVMALHQIEKEEITRKVKKEFGLYELGAKIAATTLQLTEMKAVFPDREGPYSNNVKAEVNKRLEKKDGVYSRIMTERTKSIEAVWLAGVPDAVVKLLEKIDSQLPSLQKQVAKECKTKQIKQAKKVKK